MKNQLLNSPGKGVIFVWLLFSLFSCKNPLETFSPRDLYGKVMLQLDVRMDIRNANKRITSVNTDDFVVEVRLPSGELYASYDRFADLTSGIPVEPGSYYIDVHSPNDAVVSFDNPYYYGESVLFSIDYEEQKELEITASLANCLITVSYTQQVLDQFSDYTTTVSSSGASLVYVKDESRAGYFPAEELTIETVLSFQNADGTEGTKVLKGLIPDAQPQTHYEIHIDASLDEGSVPLAIAVDESLYSEIIEIGENIVEGPVLYGDLLITEIMYDPTAVPDADGEWFEIYNATDSPIDLFHLVIKKGTDIKHTVDENVIVEPNGFMVLAKGAAATAEAGYLYGGSLSLTNSGDHLVLANYGTSGSNGSVIASVNYGNPGFPDPAGTSICLDPGSFDADLASDGANWCVSTSAFDTGDLGTPGSVNDPCE